MARHGKRTAVAAVLVGALGAGMAACGPDRDTGTAAPSAPSGPVSASPSATDTKSDVTVLLPESRTVGAKVRSVRSDFRVDVNGKLISGQAFGDRDGNCVGWVDTNGADRADFVRKGGTVWVTSKGSATTLRLPAGNTTAKQLTGYCETGMEILATGGLSTVGTEAINVPAGNREVGGVKAQVFKDRTGSGSELTIAVEGPAYLLSMSATSPARIEMQFSDFDRPVEAVAPSGPNIVDGTKYLGGSGQ